MEAYKEAFADFDWNKSGTIPTSVRSRPKDLHKTTIIKSRKKLYFFVMAFNLAFVSFCFQELQFALRRAGQNPTDVEVTLIKNFLNSRKTAQKTLTSRGVKT